MKNKITDFGSRLKKLRQDAGLTTTSLARRIGLTASYLSHIEKGIDRPPTKVRLEQIAFVLGLSKKKRKKLFSIAFKERNKRELEFLKSEIESEIKINGSNQSISIGPVKDIIESLKGQKAKIDAAIEALEALTKVLDNLVRTGLFIYEPKKRGQKK